MQHQASPRPPEGHTQPAFGWPAWPLPLLAGLLPLVATVVAFALSARLGFIEPCNPFIDGCVSISRAARHGLPNHLFRALVLPAAALQALCWLLCGAWLRTLSAVSTRKLRALRWLGPAAAGFLVLYGAFLGTEGEAYRWMRRYGVMLFFGGTCIAMLIVSDATRGLALRARHVARALPLLCMVLPLLGLANAFAPLFQADAHTRDALQNSTEWWGALIFTLFFVAISWLWHATRFEIRFCSLSPSEGDR
ncbi:hypothetical protein [Piscinibacter sp. XHJ-5]|uniref:hypothetical protein n=1 Tax=Piscinibacter sp. XHJ-5 TaxID=3037797 RepID=UPI002452FEDA|nr:hypothetical protein [Piscinibacter sp. XHJ-5]